MTINVNRNISTLLSAGILYRNFKKEKKSSIDLKK